MKKLNLFSILFAVGVLSISFVQHLQAILDQSSVAIADQNETPQLNWTRVTAKFNREKFIADCDQEHNTDYAKSINLSDLDYDKKLIETCWKALFKLKDSYAQQNDYENKTFSYQSMAKLLLTYNRFPASCRNADGEKKFLKRLIDKIGRRITPALVPEKHGKLKRWFHIYEGMLFLKYAKMFASSPERRIAHAYREFKEAIKSKTTKTTYLLAAETILDYGHIPNGMTRAEAEKLAHEYIEEAKKRQNRSRQNNNVQSKEVQTTVEKHARPTYMNELDNNKSKSTIHHVESNIIPLLPNELLVVQDELVGYDFTQLQIPRRQNSEGLIVRNQSMNRIGDLEEIYHLDGNALRRQNVSGNNMRCFFNAMGLNPEGQMAQLAFFMNDPILRWMIANEIVSAVADPDQVPEQVKQAVDFDLYRIQRDALAVFEEERNALLRAQGPDEHHQDLQLLDPIYQNLHQRNEEILEGLRVRALSLNAYNAFINYHIGHSEMMVTLRDLQDNNNANFTSIDAIAYINNIGIKIYRPAVGGGLTLIHKYIPQNATEVAYVYHQGVHFQALVPVQEDVESIDLVIPEELMDAEHENNDEIQFPSVEELQKLYPMVKTCIDSHHYDANFVRRILYTYQYLNKTYKEVGVIFNIGYNKTYNISIANNISKGRYFSNDVKNKMLQAYLECYKDIENKKIAKRDLARALCLEFKKDRNNIVSEKKLIYFFENMHRKQKMDDSINKKQSDEVKKLYLEGKSFVDIQEKTGLNLLTIISVLDEQLDPKDYKNPMNLVIEKEILLEEEKDRLIIEAFNKLKKDANGKIPSVSSVVKSLKEHKIGYKVCARILKQGNFIEQNIKSSHLSREKRQNIIEGYTKINPRNKNEQKQAHQLLAKKHGATLLQVQELLKNNSYQSERKKEIQANYDNVVNMYDGLSDEQKKSPTNIIAMKMSLSQKTVLNILKKANRYLPNGKSGANILVANTDKNKEIQKKRKRMEERMEEEELPVKKKKK